MRNAEKLTPALFQPVDVLAVQKLRYGNVRHGGLRARPMPMLHARWTPEDVSGPDFLNGAAPALGPAKA
jgi:hypothetical protein